MISETIEPKSNSRIMDFISAFDKKLAELSGWIIVLMMLSISYDVIMRYFFKAPTTWSFEVSRYMLIMVVFLGGGWALPADGHVSVDIVTDKLSRKKQKAFIIVSTIISAGYLLTFFIQSVAFTHDAWANGVRSTEYLAWPLWPIRFFLVIGSGMLFLECVLKIMRTFNVMQPQNA